MAIRKETVKQQFEEAVQPLLEPGEQVVARSASVFGPSPWLTGAFGLIGILLGQRYRFVTATDRRIIVMKSGFFSGRPKGLAYIDPRGSVSVIEADTNNVVWSKLKVRRPDGSDVRMNFHRIWRDEAQQVSAALGAGAQTAPAAAPPAPPAPSA